ncbi:hypothetical protein E3U55_16985 [Filobacillus milosensis]|uniref:SCP domain-containing protein n=2 Tax=Filobacillus milosensis TaxID=94137 RepID=A0A4Y8ID28_9BACI|nr:hypothetical protein E3U55_16985 [Filobacillus milosensis]
MILVGCNMEEGAENNGQGNPENVSFGGNNQGGDENDLGLNPNWNGNKNDFPFFDGNNDGNVNFPYESDRGFNYNHRNNEVEPNDRNPNANQGNQNQQQGNNNQAPTGNQSAQASDIVKEVVRLTNQERKKNGLSALKIDSRLNEAAQAKSVDMADNGYFSHQSPTYGSPFEMLDQFGINYTVAAENIAAGQKSAAQVVKQWMNSEGHRKNILNDSVTHIGIGYEPSGNMSPYWTQLFIAK